MIPIFLDVLPAKAAAEAEASPASMLLATVAILVVAALIYVDWTGAGRDRRWSPPMREASTLAVPPCPSCGAASVYYAPSGAAECLYCRAAIQVERGERARLRELAAVVVREEATR